MQLLITIPGVGELLGLTLASEIGDISRFPTARKLFGYSGLTPTSNSPVRAPGSGALQVRLDILRWAAVEAAQQAWRPNKPWQPLYLDVKQSCHGKANPAKAAVARKILIAAWHVLARQQPFNPSRPHDADTPVPASSIRLAHSRPTKN